MRRGSVPKLLPIRLPSAIDELIRCEYPDTDCAARVFLNFLAPATAGADFSGELIDLAQGKLGGMWEFRCVAVLMLERLILFPEEHRCCAAELYQKVHGCSSARDPLLPFPELRQRLRRLRRVHKRVRGLKTGTEALLDFIHVSRQPCKLTLGRYLFNPLEVAGRIEAAVRRSRGLPHRANADDWEESAVRYRRTQLNRSEEPVADVLTASGHIYWVGPDTPSTINAMCEYPLGTVALVVKPPGSDVEFEIKRTGVRGTHPLNVVFSRGGRQVPWSHRLHGGSSGAMLDAELRSGALLSQIYESVHGVPAPMSVALGVSTIRTIPGCRGEEHLLSYFTNRGAFGNGFGSMRSAMQRCVDAFEKDDALASLPGDLGLTIRFLRHVAPHQALFAGTSSFRLQTLERYLSAEGPEAYFRQGLQRSYTPSDARRLADDLLEEILGEFQPVDTQRSYCEYLDTIFARPSNRKRADRAYLSLIGEMGKYWGTLVALGGFSWGESFVDRNVGVRSRWLRSGWRPRMCFMDHDSLVIRREGDLELERMIDGMRNDEWYICGDKTGPFDAVGNVLALNRIYRTGADTQRRGGEVLRSAIAVGYRKTKLALRTNDTVRQYFSADFLRKLSDWEVVVRSRLIALHDGAAYESWSVGEQARLRAKGYTPERTKELTQSAQYGYDFFERYAFLYGRSQRRLNLSKMQAAG